MHLPDTPRMSVLAAVLVAGLLGHVPAARAQDAQFGTWWVKFESSNLDGRLAACGLNFGALVKEKVQGKDAAVLVIGLLFYQSINDTLSAALKIGTGQLTGRGDKVSEVPMRPHAAWPRSSSGRDFAANIVSSRADEGPGELFVVLRADDALRTGLRESLLAGRLTILYSRTAGTPPIAVPLELDVVAVDRAGNRSRSRRAIDEVLKCNEALARP